MIKVNKNSFFKFIFIVVFIVFVIAYVIGVSGYYEYDLANKKVLTEERIKEFEKDVENNENIDIKDYVVDTHRDYTNKFTKSVTGVSITLNKYLKKTIEKAFNLVSKMVKD